LTHNLLELCIFPLTVVNSYYKREFNLSTDYSKWKKNYLVQVSHARLGHSRVYFTF